MVILLCSWTRTINIATYPHYPSSVILIANLMEFRVTMVTNLMACLQEIIQTRLIDMEEQP